MADEHTHLLVSILPAPLLTPLGTVLLDRDQKYTLMALLERSSTSQPPPFLLNDGPYVPVPVAATPHPEFPLTFTSQSVVCVVLRAKMKRSPEGA